MADLKHNRRVQPPHASRRRRGCAFLLRLTLLMFLGFSARCGAAEVIPHSHAFEVSSGLNPPFVIADLDGDVHPDLAVVQAGMGASGDTSYWIQLQLSKGGLQSIRLVGPAGGLRIEARDVNGDHALDLILATAWFRQPVAILLNDGHGRFSQVEPARFPEAFADSNTKWATTCDAAADALGLPPQLRYGTSQGGARLFGEPARAARTRYLNVEFLFAALQLPHEGRAPPFDL